MGSWKCQCPGLGGNTDKASWQGGFWKVSNPQLTNAKNKAKSPSFQTQNLNSVLHSWAVISKLDYALGKQASRSHVHLQQSVRGACLVARVGDFLVSRLRRSNDLRRLCRIKGCVGSFLIYFPTFFSVFFFCLISFNYFSFLLFLCFSFPPFFLLTLFFSFFFYHHFFLLLSFSPF